MSGIEDIDGFAAEYVLGTLDPAERAMADVQRKRDPALEAAITAWEQRLAPLNEAAPGLVPPDHLQALILARIERAQADNIVVLPSRGRSTVYGKRSLIAVGAALAACLAVAVMLTVGSDSQPKSYRAALHMTADRSGTADAAASPVVSLDTRTGQLTFTSGPLKPIAGKSYVLWGEIGTVATQVRFGVVPVSGRVSTPWPKQLDLSALEGTRIFLTLEPVGNNEARASSTPSGAAIFEGALRPLP